MEPASPYLDIAIVSGVVNVLFTALMLVWRARTNDLKESLKLERERNTNLTEALEECYEHHGTHSTDSPSGPVEA